MALLGGGASVGVAASGCSSTPFTGYGPLQPPDGNGLALPSGFTSRVVAVAGQVVGSTGYVFPADPDGAATFARDGGGWIHVVNHESFAPNGGASRIEFDADGTIADAGRILTGTTRNCAGGATPWGTWLSCEEIDTGRVWECDPTGQRAAVAHDGLGRFNHEAVALDPDGRFAYLTEDRPDGGLYRFELATPGDLSTGRLDVLCQEASELLWRPIPDPDGSPTATRYQVPTTKPFNGGEGIVWSGDSVYFTTKGDNRVWRHHPIDTTSSVLAADGLSVFFDGNAVSPVVLSGVDNITYGPRGGLFVAEDGGDMQVVMLLGSDPQPVAQVVGVTGSEITGPSFTPDGSRLYFSSQRNPGTTYEVSGPWKANV